MEKFRYLYFVFLVFAFFIAFKIVTENRKSDRTLCWILFLYAFPPLAILVYFISGKIYRTKKSKLTKDYSFSYKLNNISLEEYSSLPSLIYKCGGSSLFINNNVVIFKDGNEKFISLLEKLNSANHHIHLVYFIFNDDELGNKVKNILISKAQSGVKVRVVYDLFGCIKTPRRFFKDMSESGVEVITYSWYLNSFVNKLKLRLNYRNHRKIAIIDGHTGFTGGNNIGDEYLGKSKMGYWRDTHLMIEGEGVYGLQAIFFNDFFSIKKKKYTNFNLEENLDEYFPNVEKSGDVLIQIAASGAASPFASVMKSLQKMICIAKKSINITTPYFIPSESILDALKIALLSGVEVNIVFPGQYDHYFVYKASLSYLSEICNYGANIYFYPKDCFMHAKSITIDGKISSVGSANLDNRSFYLNEELFAFIYNEDKTNVIDSLFKEDVAISTIRTCEWFKKQSKFEKTLQSFCRLASALM